MNLGAVLVTGLFAGGISCAAVQGGLLAGLVARQRGVSATINPAGAQAGDDLLPVGAFLGSKLVSHTLLGALLGAVGAAFTLSPTVRIWTQLAAGALIIAFGLAPLGVGLFARVRITPPAAWGTVRTRPGHRLTQQGR